MKKVSVNLKNCYGIRSLEAEFDFTRKNANVIYAPNGMMKTSFANTFKDYSTKEETRDRIYTSREPTRKILDENGDAISEETVFVIEPYVSSFESTRISTLLANKQLKQEYDKILENINLKKNDFIAHMKTSSGLKTNIEDIISVVFTKQNDNFLRALDRVRSEVKEEKNSPLSQLLYVNIFNEKVEKFLDTADFKNQLTEYTTTYDELLSKSRFFRKGVFNHYQAGEIAKQLKTHGFFKADHTIYLNSKGEDKKISSEAELEAIIDEEMKQILSDAKLKKAFDGIDSKLKANQDLRAFREFLLSNQNIISQLSNPELFKENLWKAYFVQHRDIYNTLMDEYDTGKKRIEEITTKASKEATKWQGVINIFNRRFSVPFKVSIENKQDVILKSDTPNLSFQFDDEEDNPVPIERNKLVDILSNGEKRALYILNIIFEVEARKEAGIQTLFIVDDVADSFDYKNKYAIIEYLNDILHEGDFKQIILTHNYDFYRTVWKRFDLGGANFHVSKQRGTINLLPEEMYKNPFEKWKKHAHRNEHAVMFIAMIPFVRNIAEYCGFSDEQNILTSLLHIKENTDSISVKDLAELFSKVLNNQDFNNLMENENSVKELIFDEANKITESDVKLEQKIVLSIGIRLKSEQFMISKINDIEFTGNISSNQTAKFIRCYKEKFADDANEQDNIRTMDRVNLMTPENIHLNSFMYEPILDMSTEHLIQLYNDICNLS